jgi:hypothetical protein
MKEYIMSIISTPEFKIGAAILITQELIAISKWLKPNSIGQLLIAGLIETAKLIWPKLDDNGSDKK